MNNNMTDILEQYIMNLFNEATEDHIIIKRSNVAQKFDCVPSQLNYVIKTRFTPEHGFIIESKRGGGGFIRITKITLHKNKDYIDYLIETIDKEILEILEILKASKDKLDTSINILLLEGIDSTVSNEMFLASKTTKEFVKLKVMDLKLKYMLKMLEDLNDD